MSKMNQEVNPDEKHKLWLYVEKWLSAACEKYDSDNVSKIEPLIEVLSLIVSKYKVEDFSKKLTYLFLQMNESIINNVGLCIILIKNGIISISEWDVQLAMFLKDSAA